MTGERSYTTKIWRPPSSIGFSSADALSTSMDPPGEPVISTWKRPCQKIQNGSEFPELVAQNSRNPHQTSICCLSPAGPAQKIEFVISCQSRNNSMGASGAYAPSPSRQLTRPGRLRAEEILLCFAPATRRCGFLFLL